MFFRVFRAFRGSDTAWTTFLHIRVHSCPFVVLPLPPPSCFSCISWFKHCLDYVFAYSCPFVSIRVHSWFSLFHIPRDISCISCFSWFKHCLDDVFAYSCPFVVLPLPPPSCFSWFSCPFVVQTLLGLRSCPFVSIRGSPPSPSFMFFVVQTLLGLCFCPFVSIRVHSWFSLFTLLRVFSCISCISWFKHCLDDVFVYSCPLVSIRGSPSSPSFVFFRVFRVFRGSDTAWTTFLHIRVHSCPFVVLPLPHPSCFFVLFVV